MNTKSNTMLYNGIFLLPAAVAAVQNLKYGQYLFLLAAGACAVFLFWRIRKVTARTGKVTPGGQWFYQNTETELLLTAVVLLQTLYYSLGNLHYLLVIRKNLTIFLWIPLYLLLLWGVDALVKKTMPAIHLKALVGLLFVCFHGKLLYMEESNLQILLSLQVIGITYLSALKQTICTEPKHRTGLRFPILYRCSAVVLFCVQLYCYNRPVDLLWSLIYEPVQALPLNWFLVAVLAIGAGIMFLDKEKNVAKWCKASNLLAVLIYDLAAANGKVDRFSLMGVAIACLCAETLVTLFQKKGWIRDIFSFGMFYLPCLPVMYLLAENTGKGRSWMLVLFLLTVLALELAVREDEKETSGRTRLVLVTLPYFWMMAASGNLKAVSMTAAIFATTGLVLLYEKIAKENHPNHPTQAKQPVKRAVMAFFVAVPLLMAMVYTAGNHRFMDLRLIDGMGMPQKGNKVSITLHGFQDSDVGAVYVRWGNGINEKFSGTDGIGSSVQSPLVTVQVMEKDGKIYTYRELLPVWPVEIR